MSQKYGRTYHYPFSPGTTNDDRINHEYWSDIMKIETLVHTEKLDGENNCMNRFGVFARSHAAPTVSSWTKDIRNRWELMKNDFGDLEFFGENLYAVHSIEYKRIEEYYFIFAVRCLDKWLSWDEVKFYAELYDFPTVPELCIENVSDLTKEKLESTILNMSKEDSVFTSVDAYSGYPCTREGIVTRNFSEFECDSFRKNVFKYVRKGHVKTTEHWTRNWRRAKLIWEFNN